MELKTTYEKLQEINDIPKLTDRREALKELCSKQENRNLLQLFDFNFAPTYKPVMPKGLPEQADIYDNRKEYAAFALLSEIPYIQIFYTPYYGGQIPNASTIAQLTFNLCHMLSGLTKDDVEVMIAVKDKELETLFPKINKKLIETTFNIKYGK